LLRQFEFANNNREIAMVTTDCRIRFYSLAKYEGILLREISTVHRGNIVSMDISNNSGYMLTGGEDNMIKVWDYEANKTLPFFFQSFIGHTYPVKNLMFNPLDNSQVFSAGENDGIYVWSFYGDTDTEFSHRNLEGDITMQKITSPQT
jgi:WD40 repeat protein